MQRHDLRYNQARIITLLERTEPLLKRRKELAASNPVDADLEEQITKAINELNAKEVWSAPDKHDESAVTIQYGHTPLTWIIKHDNDNHLVAIQRCMRLVEAGADLNLRDGHGKTPVQTALEAGKVLLLSRLYDMGAQALIADENATSAESESGKVVRRAIANSKDQVPNDLDKALDQALTLRAKKRVAEVDGTPAGSDINLTQVPGGSIFTASPPRSSPETSPRAAATKHRRKSATPDELEQVPPPGPVTRSHGRGGQS